MSLDKGNVVIDLKDKSWIKEHEKKKIKDNEVNDEQLNSFDFKEFDKAIEKSFQDFLKEITINSRDDTESIELQFNKWLDEKCEKLDIMKESEIEQKIIWPISFELTKTATKVELVNLQEELLEKEKIKTETNINLKVGTEELKWLTKTYNNIKKEDIANLFDNNFDNRNHLLDLLKTKAPGNIKKFQRIIAWINENDSSKDKSPEIKKILGNTWVDWLFWINTLNAFKDYVSKNTPATQAEITSEENDINNQKRIQATANETATITPASTKWNKVEKGTTTSDIEQYEFEINQLTEKEINETKAKEIVEKETAAWRETISLGGIKKLTKEIARELAKFKWALHFSWLEKLDEDVLNEFKQGECTLVQFPWGTMTKEDWEITITLKDGTVYNEITSKVCNLLINNNAYKTNTQVTTGSKPAATAATSATQTNSNSNQKPANKTWWKNTSESKEISLMPKELEAKLNWEIKKIADNLPEIRVLSDGIYIPKNLWTSRWFNVLYNPELEQYMKKQVITNDGPEYFVVPSNIKIWLVTGVLVPYLVLWDYESNNWSKNLDPDLQFNWHPERYTWNLAQASLKITEWAAIEWNESEWDIAEESSSTTWTNSWTKVEIANKWVNYETSQTMSRENYKRKLENAKHEKDAIKKLLGKWFLWMFSWKATEELSIWQKWYRINLRSEEYNNLQSLYSVLDEFVKEKDENYTLIDYFEVIAEKYQDWQRSFDGKSNDLMILNKKDSNGSYFNPKWFLVNKYDVLWNLYVKYKNNEWWAYFNAVMWKLEDYFIRWTISVEDLANWTAFTKIFDENNYWVAEWWVDLEKLNINFDENEKSKDKTWYNEKWEKEFMAMLSDFNLDWNLTSQDRWGYMWLELDSIYKSINIDLQNSELSEQIESWQFVWKNIVNFAIDYFEAMWDNDTAAELKSVNTIDELNAKLKEKKWDEWYKTLKALQTMLKDSPVPISFICKYWNKAQVMFLNELMMDEKFDEMYDEAFENLVQQWLDPKLKTWLKPAIYASYINWWIWGGLWAAYENKNIWTLSMSLWATHVPWSKDLQYWIVLWWNPNRAEVKAWEWKVKFWIDAWYSTNGFLALWKADFISWIINKKALDAIKPVPVKHLTIGATAWWLGDWLYASLKWWVERDYLEWIIDNHNKLNQLFRESLANIFDDEKFDEFITDWKIDTTKWEEIKAYIKGKLEETWQKNQDVINAATENIYSGLMYFSSWLNFDKNDEEAFNIAKNRVIYQLSETYTNKYISDYVNSLDWKTKLTQRNIGPAIFYNGNWVESIAKSIYYSAVWTVWFTKYGNTYMTETDQSKTQYENRLSTWMWFDYLEWSVDENWKITQRSVDYLNDKLSIIGNYNLEKMQITIQTIDGDESKKVLYIPKELIKKWWVMVHLDQSLNDYIESDTNGFKVPLNTEVALLTRSNTNATSFDLIIGNYKKESDAIQLAPKSEFTWDPTNYSPIFESGKRFNIDTINNSLSWLIEEKPEFPLLKCERTNDKKISFIPATWKIIKIDQSSNSELSIENWKLIMNSQWILTIKKESNGEFTASFEQSNDDKLTITYNDWSINTITSTWESLWDIFDSYESINNMFNWIEERLSKLDDIQQWNYVLFMDAASNLWLNDILEAEDYEIAYKRLDIMLSKLNSTDLKDTRLNELKQMIDTWNVSDEEKALIVDRFKMIFSYHIDLSDWQNDWKYLESLADQRWNVYENLKWYDKTIEFPFKWEHLRDDIVNQLKDKDHLERKVHPDLVGLTAFYRYIDPYYYEICNKQTPENPYGKLIKIRKKNNSIKNTTIWRWYSMTEMWKTTVLWDTYIELTGDREGNARDWLIANFNKSEIHKEILISSLSKKIKSKLNLKEDFKLSDADLQKILKWNENTIDIWPRKYRISTTCVFYLLGECGNESIWLEIWNIAGPWIWWEWDEWTITIDQETSYEWVSWVYVWNVEAANRTVLQEVVKFGWWAAVGIGEWWPTGGWTWWPTGGWTWHTPGTPLIDKRQ